MFRGLRGVATGGGRGPLRAVLRPSGSARHRWMTGSSAFSLVLRSRSDATTKPLALAPANLRRAMPYARND